MLHGRQRLVPTAERGEIASGSGLHDCHRRIGAGGHERGGARCKGREAAHPPRQATRDSLLSPVLRAMDTRARGPILPTPVPVWKIPSLAIPGVLERSPHDGNAPVRARPEPEKYLSLRGTGSSNPASSSGELLRLRSSQARPASRANLTSLDYDLSCRPCARRARVCAAGGNGPRVEHLPRAPSSLT